MGLGGGRRSADQTVDHAVGLSSLLSRHSPVEKGEPLAMIHARSETAFEAAAAELRDAYEIVEEAGALAAPVIERIGA